MTVAYAVSASGQSPAPASCEEVLASPTKDSVALDVMLRIHASDRELPLGAQLAVSDAILHHLVLPRPLGVDTYALSADTITSHTAHLALSGIYTGVLSVNGRIAKVAVTGGARNREFDLAVLAAMNGVDSLELPADVRGTKPGDEMPIRVDITTRDSTNRSGGSLLAPVLVTAFSMAVTSSARPGVVPVLPRGAGPITAAEPDPEPGIPIFRFRVPVRPVTNGIKQVPGAGALSYPASRRQAGTMGRVRLSFIIDADGRVELNSTDVMNEPQHEFLNSVMDAMPAFRYRPLAVSGCAVRGIAEQLFNFYAAR